MAVPLRPVAVQFRPALAPAVSSYREFGPAPAIARAVACTWQGTAGWPRQMRLLPDGCLDLVWDGQRIRAVRPAARQVRRAVGGTAVVVGIRIRPGWAGAVLGVQTILRFSRFRAWLTAPGQAPTPLARAAAECGYFDHAHLCRDCARLAGATPTLLLAAASPGRRLPWMCEQRASAWRGGAQAP